MAQDISGTSLATTSIANYRQATLEVSFQWDGTNWTDAYVCLQDALTATQYGDEIHIAEGIYQIKDARVFSYHNVR